MAKATGRDPETGRLDMSAPSATRRRTVTALLIGVLVLSLPGTGLLTLGMMLRGLAAAGGGARTSGSANATLFLVGSAVAFAVSAIALCGREMASLVSRYNFQSNSPRSKPEARAFQVSAPAYSWTCHVCEASNPAGQVACTACGAAPSLSMAQVAAAKEKLGGDWRRPDTHR